jgi:hypothetical protein
MRTILAVDPGEDQGWACATGEVLACCGLGAIDPLIRPDVLVVEQPWLERGNHGRCRPQDMIILARKVGRLEERYERRVRSIHLPFPHQWKGNADKAVVDANLWPMLSPHERSILRTCLARIGARSKHHNVIEAVAIMVWFRENNHDG